MNKKALGILWCHVPLLAMQNTDPAKNTLLQSLSNTIAIHTATLISLHQKLEEKETEVSALKSENAEIKMQLQRLLQRFDTLT